MNKLIIILLIFASPLLFSKDVPMKDGYRQLSLKEFPKNRNGSLATFIYSQAAASDSSFENRFDSKQTLMIEAIRDSLITGRIPMANSIWKRLIKSMSSSPKSFDINQMIFSLIKQAYLRELPKLAYRGLLYKVLLEKVAHLEVEEEVFKDVLKSCKENSLCDYDTKDEIERTNDLWERRTKIFEKEMKRARSKFKNTFDPQDGHARLTQYVGKLFFESAEAIVSDKF